MIVRQGYASIQTLYATLKMFLVWAEYPNTWPIALHFNFFTTQTIPARIRPSARTKANDQRDHIKDRGKDRFDSDLSSCGNILLEVKISPDATVRGILMNHNHLNKQPSTSEDLFFFANKIFIDTVRTKLPRPINWRAPQRQILRLESSPYRASADPLAATPAMNACTPQTEWFSGGKIPLAYE